MLPHTINVRWSCYSLLTSTMCQSCCVLLDVADTYHADQLKSLCLHRVKRAYGILHDTQEYRALSAPLRLPMEQDI